jgi:hypothetical protein
MIPAALLLVAAMACAAQAGSYGRIQHYSAKVYGALAVLFFVVGLAAILWGSAHHWPWFAGD